MLAEWTFDERASHRVRRSVAWLTGAVAASLAVVALAAPGNAHAFAWQSTCSAAFHNATGATDGLKAALPEPAEIPPNPPDYVRWPSYTGGFDDATVYTVGIPFTGGCYIGVQLTWVGSTWNPGGEVGCIIADPTTGANTFSCSPPASFTNIRSNDDTIAGDFSFVPWSPPVIYTAISAGGYHTCALRYPTLTGVAVCWGRNDYGQATAPAGSFTEVSAGEYHSCALQRGEFSIVCWGRNDHGQASAPPGTFADVSAGGSHTCALRLADSSIACWGDDSHGQTNAPAGSFTGLTAGANHTCAIRPDDRSVACWGDNSKGQSSPPAGSFGEITAGGDHTCANRVTDGSIACWGDNSDGESSPPVGGAFTSLTAGAHHTCAWSHQRRAIVCWGAISVAPGELITDLSAGGENTCGIRGDGTAVCWGGNSYGQSSPPSGQFLRPNLARAAAGPKRLRALLRRGDLTGRGWRMITKVGQFGQLGRLWATGKVPSDCRVHGKEAEPIAKGGSESAFARGSALAGYEHGVYGTATQAHRTLSDASSRHSISCLARLLTSARHHTTATFAHYTLSGVRTDGLWRLVVSTRSGARTTRTDYLDLVALQRGRANALLMFAHVKHPADRALERTAIRAVAARLP